MEYHSPISMSGLVYYTTLIDENASCHLALGRGLNSSPAGHPDLFNDSTIHIDFMIGTSDMKNCGHHRGRPGGGNLPQRRLCPVTTNAKKAPVCRGFSVHKKAPGIPGAFLVGCLLFQGNGLNLAQHALG